VIKKLQQRYVLAKRIKKVSLRVLITFLCVLSYNLLTQSWLITSQKSKSSYEHMTDGGRSSRGAARAVFSDTSQDGTRAGNAIVPSTQLNRKLRTQV